MRGKKILLLAHCCLNQNAVLPGWERAYGAYPFTELLIRNGIGILQLPCPETLALGIDRPPLTYEDYNTNEHRTLCANICDIPLKMIQAHLDAGDEIIGIIGIQDSPNCAITHPRGVFMEVLFERLKERSIMLPYLEVPVLYSEADDRAFSDFHKAVQAWIEVIERE